MWGTGGDRQTQACGRPRCCRAGVGRGRSCGRSAHEGVSGLEGCGGRWGCRACPGVSAGHPQVAEWGTTGGPAGKVSGLNVQEEGDSWEWGGPRGGRVCLGVSAGLFSPGQIPRRGPGGVRLRGAHQAGVHRVSDDSALGVQQDGLHVRWVRPARGGLQPGQTCRPGSAPRRRGEAGPPPRALLQGPRAPVPGLLGPRRVLWLSTRIPYAQ